MGILRFDNVSKRYAGGQDALSEVSFAVEPGEMLFITGHSGAGKSTLLKLIQLAERPSRGAVLFDDKNLLKVRGRKVAMHRRDVGVVYQDHQLLTDRSVFENVALPLILRGVRRGEIGKRVRSIVERMGLGGREKALPTQLSAGEQQRVGIARALIGEPRLLVADEPTGNLDPVRASDVLDLLLEQIRDSQAAGLLVTHSRVAARRADRVLELGVQGLVDITERA